jgi:hypothetical protein
MMISSGLSTRHRGFLIQLLSPVPRGEFFAALYILGCINGFAAQMAQSVSQLGWTDAAIGTFGISAIVWIACYVGISLLIRDKSEATHFWDVVAGAGFLILVILPIGRLSWLAVAALSLYVIILTSTSATRRGAIVLLAVTAPMLWTGLLLELFSARILEVEASLVGHILGTPQVGNSVRFADNSGSLLVNSACSSLANVSLAFLCWVTICQAVSHRWSPQDVLWGLLVCGSAVAINLVRLSMMGLSHAHYVAIHANPLGEAITNLILLGWAVAISVLAVRHELFSAT